MEVFIFYVLISLLFVGSCDNVHLLKSPRRDCPRVQHLVSTVCSEAICLDTIQVKPKERPLSMRYPVLNESQIKQLREIPGFIDDNCMWLISRLSDMQWINGVYGCIGQIGDAHLKIIGLLSLNLNFTLGEKMLVSEEKNVILEKSDEIETILKNMGPLNYKLHKGYIVNMTSVSDFERFRFVNINGWNDLNLLIRSMDYSTCLLRDGGIISIDEIDAPDSSALQAVELFLSKHGTSVFTPFIHAKNRLFLTTTNYFNSYYRFFVENRHLLLAYGLREVSSKRFGARYSYFISEE
ncbi:unnamed protein product [Dimorphilus gyrociliatus]|uniref:Uncharacterized protein n=1 Tax=Dimorphilus gyrociliatus TaxID=2664684 RepID=A0A7I8VCL4_9ANNE|nr:unnamed protein product [Dimorphilus gyrociliatus]